MEIKLHANATTTPRTRKYIQESNKSVAQLAKELGVSEQTIRRWRKRQTVNDLPSQKHKLPTTLSQPQEWLVVELRKLLLLPLDDLLVVTRRFINPAVSRSGLDRCLRRFGVNRLQDLLPETEPKTPPKRFKDYDPGYVHVDLKYLPQMQDEDQRKYLYVAIDRATRWVYLEILPDKKATTATLFLEKLCNAAPFKIKIILTDNGKEFTDRFCTSGDRKPTGKPSFDLLCKKHDIEHRLIKPRYPQTNGMVERFNKRIADILKRTTFESALDLKRTINKYHLIYNQYLTQKALGHTTPLEKMKLFYKEKPDLFVKRPTNRRGPDIYALDYKTFLYS